MGYLPSSLSRKAAHLVSDLTTFILNPLSDPPSERREEPVVKSSDNPDSGLQDGPDTSSFTAFLVSLLSSTDPSAHGTEESREQESRMGETSSVPELKEYPEKKGLFSRGKHSIGKGLQRVARIAGYRHSSEAKAADTTNDLQLVAPGLKSAKMIVENGSLFHLPDISEPSSIMSEDMRKFLYFSLPAVAQGRVWLLLYSTWRHGISLSTMYRKSFLCPGYCLLVVGDQKGTVFGGLVEAPLRPSNKKYQGTNSSFVFTNLYNNPVIFRPTGINHYFILCSPDYFAMGGGSHFALYLEADLLSGSSYKSETFGNSCLAHSENFKVKEIELWGFVYASKYQEMLSLSKAEKPGISSW
ncbi:hypothetical protein HPP92_016205 [Vanilla planifolia]|uniref:Oxidation resistance protein 1 n=1 Tax=Vanilla planifolia TaxID=51239 RepID=A0A835QL23_VANPL|nr:hypothetical protein HPP92_016205 [Vanilla planifolia]